MHVFSAEPQPATRFVVVAGDRRHWITNPARRQLFAACCKRSRIAKNLVAHVYYDGTWLYCKKGKGCKQ